MRGVFVTATDTGVGKTVASAALLLRYRGVAGPLSYWKPIQTGIEQDDDTAEVRRLAACPDREIFEGGVRLREPVSPHLAARGVGICLSADETVSNVPAADCLIVEGAGGVLVPLNETELMTDLMARLQLPVLVVTRTTLGTINHTLLTLEALRQRKLQIAGVLMMGEPNDDNREAIEHYGNVQVVGEIPVLRPLTPASGRQSVSRIKSAYMTNKPSTENPNGVVL